MAHPIDTLGYSYCLLSPVSKSSGFVCVTSLCPEKADLSSSPGKEASLVKTSHRRHFLFACDEKREGS